MRAAVSVSTAACGLGAKALCRLGLDLSCLARLDVVTAAPDLAQNPRLHHAALEALQRPVDAIGFIQVDLDHRSSRAVGWRRAAPPGPNGPGQCGANPRPRDARAWVFSGRASKRSRRRVPSGPGRRRTPPA